MVPVPGGWICLSLVTLWPFMKHHEMEDMSKTSHGLIFSEITGGHWNLSTCDCCCHFFLWLSPALKRSHFHFMLDYLIFCSSYQSYCTTKKVMSDDHKNIHKHKNNNMSWEGTDALHSAPMALSSICIKTNACHLSFTASPGLNVSVMSSLPPWAAIVNDFLSFMDL